MDESQPPGWRASSRARGLMVVEGQLPTRVAVRARRSIVYVLLGLAWLGTMCVGLLWLSDFELTAGPALSAPASWPPRAKLSRDEPYTLVMAAHPRCPCTRASMEELAIVMQASGGRMRAHVLFFAPAQADESWWKTDLWEKAAAIPGVTPHLDRGGLLQRAFGATTSGTVLVYDHDDRLRFQGGVTAARGHAGDNAGRRSLIALMDAGEQTLDETPVFGCPLHTPDPARAQSVPLAPATSDSAAPKRTAPKPVALVSAPSEPAPSVTDGSPER